MSDPNLINQLLEPHTRGDAAEAFSRFLAIIKKLRDPDGGCPWDIKQTFESLKPHLIEEAYEVVDAASSSPEELCEELGDLLSVMALFCQIGSDQKQFSFETAITSIIDKLIRRHPHVFGDTKVAGTDEVLKNWESIKKSEQSEKGPEAKGLLDGLPKSMPALLKSFRIGEKCGRVGFDWQNASEVRCKVEEELREFLETIDRDESAERRSEEFGDLLFAVTQLGRHMGINSEVALQDANEKFCKRFKALEELAKLRPEKGEIRSIPKEQLEELWEAVKRDEKQ